MKKSIFNFVKDWFESPPSNPQLLGRLKIPSKTLPSATIRVFNDEDFEACSKIYRLNEPQRFPAGYHECFTDFIRSRKSLFLIVEVDGVVIGFGGVKRFPPPDDSDANLNFGMIHPEYQKRGYGTVLLLARLATLPEPSPRFFVGTSPVKLSESFYDRFGFRFNSTYKDSFDNEVASLYAIALTANDWKACRSALSEAGIKIEVDPEDIPRIVVE